MVENTEDARAAPDSSTAREVRISPLLGLPALQPGDDLAGLLAKSIERAGGLLVGDVLVVAQKVVSKSEGRLAPATSQADIEELIRSEARRVRRRRDDLFIVETHQGFVCATAGIDHSNTPDAETVILLPVNPDASAAGLSAHLGTHFGIEAPPVIIADSFGRAWRTGTVDIAIGVAGMEPLIDLRGTLDWAGRELESTQVAVADELAAAAHLVMGKADGVPAALVRGAVVEHGDGSAIELVMPPERDLFP